MGRQGDLLALLEPVPTPTPAMRATLVPMLAALLLEAVGESEPNRATGRPKADEEARDDQDRN